MIGINHPDSHAKTGGFARTISTKKTNDFGLVDVETHILDHGAAAERFAKIFGLKEWHGALIVRVPGRRTHGLDLCNK